MEKLKTIIRKAKFSDCKEIASLLTQLGYPVGRAALQKRLKKLNTRHDLILVAWIGKKMIGFISSHFIPLIHENGFCVRITALIVDEFYRGKGIGKTLVKATEKFAKKKGAIKSEVTSGTPRKTAHSFYESLGYIEYRRRFLKRFDKK